MAMIDISHSYLFTLMHRKRHVLHNIIV